MPHTASVCAVKVMRPGKLQILICLLALFIVVTPVQTSARRIFFELIFFRQYVISLQNLSVFAVPCVVPCPTWMQLFSNQTAALNNQCKLCVILALILQNFERYASNLPLYLVNRNAFEFKSLAESTPLVGNQPKKRLACAFFKICYMRA